MGKEVGIANGRLSNPQNAIGKTIKRMLGSAEQKIHQVLNDLKTTGISKRRPFTVGHVEKRMRNFANSVGVDIADGDLYMSPKGITHALRPSKIRDGIAVSESALEKFPSQRNKMDLFFDGKVFVYTDYANKFIIHPNYEIKIGGGKVKKINFVTAGKVTDSSEFNNPRYRRI